MVKNWYEICTKSVQILYKICTKLVRQKAGFLAKINRQQKLAGRGVKKLRFLEKSQIDNVPARKHSSFCDNFISD